MLSNVDLSKGECPIPDGTILLAYRGSIAHNMFVPSTDPNSIDDIDVIGFVVGPEECYFGLKEWGSRGTQEVKSGQFDAVFYELRKAFSLLLQGNPNILSTLWMRHESYLYRSEAARRIIENRRMFVGKHVYSAFAGYAYAQLSKMETRDAAELEEYLAVTAELKFRGQHPNHKGEEHPEPERNSGTLRDVSNWASDKLIARLRTFQKKGENVGYLGDKRKRLVLEHGYDSKNAAHCIRLLRMAKEFLLAGEMEVFRTSDRDELLDIKRGGWALSDIKELAEQLFAEIKAARDVSPLPDGPDRDRAERLLIDILRAQVA